MGVVFFKAIYILSHLYHVEVENIYSKLAFTGIKRLSYRDFTAVSP